MRVFRFGESGWGSAASSSSSEAGCKVARRARVFARALLGTTGLRERGSGPARGVDARRTPSRVRSAPRPSEAGDGQLDFLRRDVTRAVRRAAAVEPVGVGARAPGRASDAVAHGLLATHHASPRLRPLPLRRPSIPPAAVAQTRESTAAVSEGSAPLGAVAAPSAKRAEERSERLPEPCDYQRAVWLEQDKIKVANACARHLDLITRYATWPTPGASVEAYPVSRDGDGDGDGEDEGARTVSRRRMTVDVPEQRGEAVGAGGCLRRTTAISRVRDAAGRRRASGASTHASGCGCRV